MRVAIGADHNGLKLKKIVIEFLKEKKVEYEDFGTMSPAPHPGCQSGLQPHREYLQ